MIKFFTNLSKKVAFSLIFLLFGFILQHLLIFSVNNFSYFLFPSLAVAFLISLLLPVLYKLARNWDLTEKAIRNQNIKVLKGVFFETYPIWPSFFSLIIAIKFLVFMDNRNMLFNTEILLESLVGLNYAVMISLSLLANKKNISEGEREKFEELIDKLNS